jgi:predicted porin
MKKSLLALAALGAFASVAQAQSSVTLYGIIDEGINAVSNVRIAAGQGARQYGLASGIMQGSRWGLKGAEDLGGGLKAIFQLENGFDLNTGAFGQGGAEFGRQAYVGLSSANYGALTLGRQYDSVVDFVGPLNAGDQWGGAYAAHPGDLDNFNNSVRTNNAIKYTSPNSGGLTFGGMYSLGGKAGSVTQNQVYSLGAGYVNGPLNLALAYLNAKSPNQSFFGDNPNSNLAGGSNLSSPVNSGYASAGSYQVIGAGGSYAFGLATIGLTYSNTRFNNLGQTASGPNTLGYTGSAQFNSIEANFSYQMTPALLAGVAYNYTKGNGASMIGGGSTGGAKYNQFSLGTDYFLSKRTDVYVQGVYQTVSGTDSTNSPAVASIAGLSPSANNHQAVARVGIRHKF